MKVRGKDRTGGRCRRNANEEGTLLLHTYTHTQFESGCRTCCLWTAGGGWVANWMTDWLAGWWIVNRTTAWLTGWWTRWLAGYWLARLTGWSCMSGDWLTGWRLAGGWTANWHVISTWSHNLRHITPQFAFWIEIKEVPQASPRVLVHLTPSCRSHLTFSTLTLLPYSPFIIMNTSTLCSRCPIRPPLPCLPSMYFTLSIYPFLVLPLYQNSINGSPHSPLSPFLPYVVPIWFFLPLSYTFNLLIVSSSSSHFSSALPFPLTSTFTLFFGRQGVW